MRAIGLSITATAMLLTQYLNLSSGVAFAASDSPIEAAPGGVSDVHSGSVSVTDSAKDVGPNTISIPTAGDANQKLPIPGGLTPKGAAIPAINPISLTPSTAANQAAGKLNQPTCAFLCPTTETELGNKFGTLHLLPGSFVLLVSSEDAVTAYNLHDNKPNDVYMEVDGKKIAFTPGKHVTLSVGNYTELSEANKLPFVVYSATDKQKLNEGCMCFRGVFDIYSLIFRYPPYKALLNSEDPKMRKMAERVLKTAVIMSQLTSAAKYYNLKAPPPTTTIVK